LVASKVVLLHGLFRQPASMGKLAAALVADGHAVRALGYPSTKLAYRQILRHVAEALREHRLDGSDGPVAFVCHSLGGIIWRDIRVELPGFSSGPTVLLGAPLQGSVVARTLSGSVLARLVLGPVIRDLGVERAGRGESYPGHFATVAGTKWSPFLPAAHILRHVAGRVPSDSTVLVREARSTLAVEHLELDEVHTFLPSNPSGIAFVRSFIRSHGSGSPPT